MEQLHGDADVSENRIERPSDVLSVCFKIEDELVKSENFIDGEPANGDVETECDAHVKVESDPESSTLDEQTEAFGTHLLNFGTDDVAHGSGVDPKKKKPAGSKQKFRCEICGKEFAFKSRLQEHEKIHFDIRLFRCKVCGKAFVTKTNLVHHSRIHSGDRPYKCDVCDQYFNRSDVLRIHFKRKHSESRPYECDVCRKSFAMKYLLQTHIKIHLDERPYACDVCGRGFVTKSNMMQHLKTHENDSKRGESKRSKRKRKTINKSIPSVDCSGTALQ